jgi:hypothetical protein
MGNFMSRLNDFSHFSDNELILLCRLFDSVACTIKEDICYNPLYVELLKEIATRNFNE